LDGLAWKRSVVGVYLEPEEEKQTPNFPRSYSRVSLKLVSE
jgi:hypothetical protein